MWGAARSRWARSSRASHTKDNLRRHQHKGKNCSTHEVKKINIEKRMQKQKCLSSIHVSQGVSLSPVKCLASLLQVANASMDKLSAFAWSPRSKIIRFHQTAFQPATARVKQYTYACANNPRKHTRIKPTSACMCKYVSVFSWPKCGKLNT